MFLVRMNCTPQDCSRHMSSVLIRWMKVCEEFTMGAPLLWHKKKLFRYLGKEDRYCCGEMK